MLWWLLLLLQMLSLLRLPFLQMLRLLLMFLLHLLHSLRRRFLLLHALMFLLLPRLKLLPLFLLLVIQLLLLLLIFLIQLRVPGVRRVGPAYRRELVRMYRRVIIFGFRLRPAILRRLSLAAIRRRMILAPSFPCGDDAITFKFCRPRCGRNRRSPMILIRPQLWIRSSGPDELLLSRNRPNMMLAGGCLLL
jgi:hypothetical protein